MSYTSYRFISIVTFLTKFCFIFLTVFQNVLNYVKNILKPVYTLLTPPTVTPFESSTPTPSPGSEKQSGRRTKRIITLFPFGRTNERIRPALTVPTVAAPPPVPDVSVDADRQSRHLGNRRRYGPDRGGEPCDAVSCPWAQPTPKRASRRDS